MEIQQESKGGRYEYIDILKGFTIIWVLWMHLNLPELLYPAVQMPIFFFISGCFYRNKGSFTGQLITDFWHLLVPVISFMGIAAILMALKGGEQLWTGSVIDMIQKCRNASITWFLIALFCFRMFNYPFEKYDKKWIMLAISLVLYPLGFLWRVYYPNYSFPIIPFQEMFMFGLYYVLGNIYGKKLLSLIEIGDCKMILFGIAALIYICFVHFLDWDSGLLKYIPWMIYGFFYTIGFLVVGLLVCRYLQKFDKIIYPVSYIGKNSMPFYLTHLLVYGYVFRPLNMNLYIVFFLIVAIEFPLTYILVNHIPLIIGQKR